MDSVARPYMDVMMRVFGPQVLRPRPGSPSHMVSLSDVVDGVDCSRLVGYVNKKLNLIIYLQNFTVIAC
jgi:hypothetical protein